MFKAGINIDSATLAKNLTILCTVAFSATVLYVMYSNSRRPHYTQYTQVSFPDDEELADDDHTTQCKTRCRHSIVGNSERSRPPDRLMSFGISLDDVQSSPSRRDYCPLGSGDESPAQIQPPTDSCPFDPIATNDVNTSASTRQDGSSLNSCGLNNAETQTMTSFMGSVLNSGDFCGIDNAEKQATPSFTAPVLNSRESCGIDNAETQTMPESIMVSVLNSSSDTTVAGRAFADGALSSVGSLLAQVQPFTDSTTSGPDVTETSYTEIPPSTPTSTALGAEVFESLFTQTLPPTTATASGPGVTAAGRLDDTCLCSGVTKDPECTRAQAVLLRHSKGGESLVRSREEPNVMQCDSVENEEDDGGSHFEGYIYGIIREKGSKSYKRRLYGGVSFAEERREQIDGGCSQGRINLEEKDGVRFHEACTQVEVGVEICKNISIGGPRKIIKGVREKDRGHIVSTKEACGNTLSRDCRPSHCNSSTQTKAKDKDTCIPVGSSSASTSREACTRRPLKQLPRKDETRHLVGNNFECRDNGTNKFVDTFSGSNTRGAGRGRLLRQFSTFANEETHNLLDNNFEKCRDKGTSTSVNTFSASRTRRACTGRPLKQTRTVSKEETCHSLENDFSFVEKRTEEQRDCGITNVQPEPVDPHEQMKSSLKTLTETQHWSKMSLPEQYECLGLLDSTLAAASGEY